MNPDFLVDLVNNVSRLSYEFYHSHQGAVIRWVLGIYTCILILDVLMLIFKHQQLWDYAFYGNKTKKTLEKRAQKNPPSPWDKIKSKLNSPKPDDWRLAIIEADKLLDYALKKADYVGENIGERLKNLRDSDLEGTDLDSVWQAHKMRNNVVHDPNFEIDMREVRKAVSELERAYNSLIK